MDTHLHLICNNLDCRKVLSNQYFITPCCHAFCLECIQQIAGSANGQPPCCPACYTIISGDLELQIIRVQNPPPSEWKQRVLLGLSPVDALEAAKSALSFYSYQQSQNLIFSQSLLKKQEEERDEQKRVDQLRTYEQDLKITGLEKKIEDMKQEMIQITATLRDEANAHQETKRSLSRLQNLYDSAKSATIHQSSHQSIDQIMRSSSKANVPLDSTFKRPVIRASPPTSMQLPPSNKPFTFRDRR